jgi:uroporphyrinogen-III synthase
LRLKLIIIEEQLIKKQKKKANITDSALAAAKVNARATLMKKLIDKGIRVEEMPQYLDFLENGI